MFRAKCDNLDYSIHRDYCDKIERYGDCVEFANKNRVDSILVILDHTISDFNKEIDAWNKGEAVSVDWLRARIYEVDVLLSSLFGLRQLIGLDGLSKDGRIHIADCKLKLYFGDDYAHIAEFRKLRGFILAHPFDMGNVDQSADDIFYLEDVFVGVSQMARSFHKYDNQGAIDFTIILKQKSSNELKYAGLDFKKEVADIAVCIMNKLACMKDDVQIRIMEELDVLKHDAMNIRHDSLMNRLCDMRVELKKRYPSLFEECVSGSYCVLDDIIAMLECDFRGEMRCGFDQYMKAIIVELNKFEKNLQSMTFDDWDDGSPDDGLKNAIHPDMTCGKAFVNDKLNQIEYAFEKASKLSLRDDAHDGKDAIDYYKKNGYDACRRLTCKAWSIIHIYRISEVVKPIGLNFDFSKSNGEIATQFRVLLFMLNNNDCSYV